MKIRILAILLAAILSSFNPSVAVFGQCRSVAGGTWQGYNDNVPGSTFSLSQNVATGAITGYSHSSSCQTQNWPVSSGQPNGNGAFTITFTNPTPSDPVCIASWFTVDVNLSLPGCHKATGSWISDITSSSAQGIQYRWEKPCDVPSSESVSPGAWAPTYDERTIHGWVQILSAFNPEVNFGSRVVIEEFPSPGQDGCYFAGSIFDPNSAPEAGAWIVGSVDMVPSSTFNIWGRDYVGWHEDTVNYYQIERLARGLPLACYFTVTQQMKIACDPNPILYKTGTLSMGIDVNSVESSRHGQSTSRIWP